MDTTFDPTGLACLVALSDTGSFAAAAQRLALTPSAVSQRMRALEAQWGQPLVVRTRPLDFTPSGSVLLRLARQWQSLAAEATRQLGAASAHGERVPIGVNADSLATWVLPALDALMREGVQVGFGIDLRVDDQDFTHEALRAGTVLGCVSSLAEPLHGCGMQRLGVMPYLAVASPALLRELPAAGLRAADLARLPMLVFDRKDGMARAWAQQAFGLPDLRLRERHVPSSEAYVEAACRGWGIGVAPQLQVAAALADGRLQPVLPSVTVPVTLYWHQWLLDGVADRGLLGRIGAALQQHAAQVLEA
ncbi:ArgP/LysG family DNA-binding transcriptional regulator [Aquincola sp. J276]|uniref:ArgP/LysG family DNA-binding transcriptional regulator n=1 Tax=Aquincola sp. J276 TaxID=2898432 RepID=UPI002150AB12|nr:ArgP/LysG family DNA-binding transcriptional regulator [Aquincola sp. J276]MCR5865968.1 ArgP/LysG family DNA-binding transcriptional regulator [Aquincola sp. J276]